MSRAPLVLAHRGASRRAPENTIEAFEAARALGADGVELDVRRTVDDVLVVHHDSDDPEIGRIVELPFAELRNARPDVPTLAEALDVCTDLIVNLEMKCLPWESDPDPDRELPKAVAGIVRERGIASSVIVSSFDLEAVNSVRSLDPTIPTGWLVYGQSLAEPVEIVRELGHHALHPDRASVLEADPDEVRELTQGELALNVWTVNDPHDIARLGALGVHSVITDVPDVARQALG